MLVSKEKSGMTRSDIASKAKLSTNGGRLTERLRDLCQAGFFEEKSSWQKKFGEYYRLVDEFTLFQLYWVSSRNNKPFPEDYWITMSKTQVYKAWPGYAFENICMKHIKQIIDTLNITHVNMIDSWRFIPRINKENGAQINLLIDRNDDAITVCEIKFTQEPFYIDKQYAKNLQNKIDIFKSKTKRTKHIFLALISANGIKDSMYSEEMLSGFVTLEDLFKS